ncbi:MAG: amino acid ABC transporter permease, partial [Rhizobiales bacterium]|nr:amino acid ABC transporter permease [Hyphomicrobiales bacterium]
MTAGPPRLLPALRAGLFGTRANTLITLATLLVLSQVVPPLLRWAVLDATFTGNAGACTREGACWAFVAAKLRFILFAFYPPDL